MEHQGIRRGILLVFAAFVLGTPLLQAQAAADEKPRGPVIVPDEEILLPDGRPLPDLPVTVSGRVQNQDLRIVDWNAELATHGDKFEGKITFPDMPILLPLTVQGTRDGDIVEFFVNFGGKEVAYFAGHLAGTSLVGTFDGLTGERGNWNGLWIPESLKVRDQEVR